MPELYVHLAPPEVVQAHEEDPDPELGRPSALRDAGLYHKVVKAELRRGTEYEDEYRTYETTCGIVQRERPDRLEELDFEPVASLCPACFKKGK